MTLFYAPKENVPPVPRKYVRKARRAVADSTGRLAATRMHTDKTPVFAVPGRGAGSTPLRPAIPAEWIPAATIPEPKHNRCGRKPVPHRNLPTQPAPISSTITRREISWLSGTPALTVKTLRRSAPAAFAQVVGGLPTAKSFGCFPLGRTRPIAARIYAGYPGLEAQPASLRARFEAFLPARLQSNLPRYNGLCPAQQH